MLFQDFDDADWWFDNKVPGNNTTSIAMVEAAKTDPLAAWLIFPTMAYHKRAWAFMEMVDNGYSPDEENYLRDRLRDKDVWRRNPWLHKVLFSSPKNLRKYGARCSPFGGGIC